MVYNSETIRSPGSTGALCLLLGIVALRQLTCRTAVAAHAAAPNNTLTQVDTSSQIAAGQGSNVVATAAFAARPLVAVASSSLD